MRIARNGDVHVSVPIGMSKKAVQAFIDQHQQWIEKAREKVVEQQDKRAAFFGQLPLATKAQKAEAAEKLRAIVEPMIERHSKEMGVQPSSVSFRAMTSRWGVCKIKSRSICFSTYLLLLPEWCVEHVVVHELCHLTEPAHNARFYALMDKYYPPWREARKEARRLVKAGSSVFPGGKEIH